LLTGFPTVRPWSLGIKPLSVVARYLSDYSRFVGNLDAILSCRGMLSRWGVIQDE